MGRDAIKFAKNALVRSCLNIGGRSKQLKGSFPKSKCLHRQMRQTSPTEGEVGVDVSTNYTSNRPASEISLREYNFLLEYEQEQKS